MKSSTQQAALPFIISLFMLCLLLAPNSEAAITCGTAISSLRPCISYLQGNGGKPPQPCCAGVQSLSSAAATKADRQAACTCIKNAAQKIKINNQLAQNLPQNCGISLPIPISPSVDCNTIN